MRNILFADIDVILFDMDGTLVNSTRAVERAWGAWGARQGLPFEGLMDIVHGRRAEDSIRQLVPHLDVAEQAAEVLALELQDQDGTVPIAGAARLLAALGPRRWALVTSASEVLARHRFQLAGLQWPGVAVTSESVQRGKPDPEGYLLAARRMGCPPERCLVVEDTAAGIQAGQAAGMHVLGITTTAAAPALGCQRVVPHYEDVVVRLAERITLGLS